MSLVVMSFCFCSAAAAAAACCSLLRLSCHTGLARPRRMPLALSPVRPWLPGTHLLNMEVAGNAPAWAAAFSAAAAMATAGAAGPEVSPRELLREQGALLTLRPVGAADDAGALAGTATLALLELGLLALALLMAPVPAVECPAERLLAKGQMLKIGRAHV